MVVLVTGATGFVGRQVVKTLLARGKEVRCLVHTPGRETVLDQGTVDVHYGSVTDPAALRAAFYDIEAVVHLVAIIREKGSSAFDRINVQGVRNVVTVAATDGVKMFVHVSANGAQENPQLRYLHSKWLGERVVIESGLPYTILRPSIQFGEGDEFINTLAGLIRSFPVIPLAGSGENEFQPIAVEDVAQCVASTVDDDSLVNRIIEIGGPERLTYNQILDVVAQTQGTRRLKLNLPVPLMRTIVRLMEVLLPRPPVTAEQLKMLPISNYAELNTVEETFGFKPRPLQGHIDFVDRVGFRDGLKMALGFMPSHIRDH